MTAVAGRVGPRLFPPKELFRTVILGFVLYLAGPGSFLGREAAHWGQWEVKGPYSFPGKSWCGRDLLLQAWEAQKVKKGWICGVML